MDTYIQNGLNALGDATRLTIFEMLGSSPRAVNELAAGLPVSRPAVSQHLKALRTAKLVRVSVDAQRRIYELDGEGIEELSEWVLKIRRFWAGKLADLERRLKEET